MPIRLAELFGALMQRYNFSHNEIMELPFKTFLAYYKAPVRTQQAEDPDIEKWRKEGQEWVEKNKLKG